MGMGKPTDLKYRGDGQDPPQQGKRSTRLNGWYLDPEGQQLASRFFAAAPGAVPNNPQNLRSFQPIGPLVGAEHGMPGDLISRRNPYGDGTQIAAPEGAAVVPPTPAAQRMAAPPLAKDAELQPRTPGFGVEGTRNPLYRQARGMSTGMGAMGSGPQRNVPRGA